MPALTFEPCLSIYTTASDIPQHIIDALYANGRNANVILPGLLRARSSASRDPNEFWMTWTVSNVVEFVVAGISNNMGTYPIFIVPTVPNERLTNDHLILPLTDIVMALYKHAGVRRVYSFFAPASICKLASRLWTELTGVASYSEAYYAAKITFCTRRSYRNKQMTIHPEFIYTLRPAVMADLLQVATLCYEFADSSVSPLPLSIFDYNLTIR